MVVEHIRNLLREQCAIMAEEYHTHLQTVQYLQSVFLEDIFPSLVDELHLDQPAIEWQANWLNDTGGVTYLPFSGPGLTYENVASLFRMLRVSSTSHPIPGIVIQEFSAS
jgi:hypothetical protein